MNSNQKGQIVRLVDNGASINWEDNTGLNVNIQKSMIEFVSAQDDETVQIGLYSGLIYTIYYWQNVIEPEGIESAGYLVSLIQSWIDSGGSGGQYWEEWNQQGIINTSDGGVLSKYETDDLFFFVTASAEAGLQMAILDKASGNIKSQIYVSGDSVITLRNVDTNNGDTLTSVVLESEKITLSNAPGSTMSMYRQDSTQNVNYTGLPHYQNHNGADNDANLSAGSVYTIDNSDNLHIK